MFVYVFLFLQDKKTIGAYLRIENEHDIFFNLSLFFRLFSLLPLIYKR